MPGLSLICDRNSSLDQEKEKVDRALRAVLHDSGYKTEYYHRGPGFILASTHYQEYPVFFREDDRYLLFLEGYIYEAFAEPENKLGELRDIFAAGDAAPIEPLLDRWIQNQDGDFIILILDKMENTALLLNDAQGRLPLYYYRDRERLIVSREFRFLAQMMPQRDYDRMGIAQYLLFGYPLGARTIIKNAFRALPCMLMKLNFRDGELCSLKYLRTYNFESKRYRNRGIHQNAQELARRFERACKVRAFPGRQSIVGLSGGLDSRSVAACLHKGYNPFKATSRLSYFATEKKDAAVAQEIARSLQAEWFLVKSDNPPEGRDFLQILKRKSGFNGVTMSFMVPYLEEIIKMFGRNIVYFTGDGGLHLKDIRPVKKLRNAKELVDYTLASYQVSPLKNVTALTFVSERDIISEIERHLLEYPETDLRQKYVHFVLSERCFKWLYEGEDRNRTYFWSTAPFHATQLFHYALNCPDQQKNHFRLYHQFLLLLSSDASAVRHAKWDAPIGTVKAKLAVKKVIARKKYKSLAKIYRLRLKKKNRKTFIRRRL